MSPHFVKVSLAYKLKIDTSAIKQVLKSDMLVWTLLNAVEYKDHSSLILTLNALLKSQMVMIDIREITNLITWNIPYDSILLYAKSFNLLLGV